MVIKTTINMGGTTYQFEIEEKDEKETFAKAIVLSNPRKKCICGDTGFQGKYFTSNKDKEGNIYINVKCGACGARSKLGSLKAGGYFWHDYEVYNPAAKAQTSDESPL